MSFWLNWRNLRVSNLFWFSGIMKCFFGVIVLENVNFDFVFGEVVVIIGENGVGKFMLMKILSGVY